MGNKQSASEYGGMIIRTDKPFYFAGEVVTGNIYLNVSKYGFPGRVIQLKVTGKEKCYWIEEYTESVSESDGSSSTRTVQEKHNGKKQFYQHRIGIQTFDTPVLPVGQYVFPFSFQLYSYLPGSFNEKGKDYMAKTSYRVKAEIESLSNEYKNMKHTQEFIVREPLKTKIDSLKGEMEVEVTTCCCVNEGTSYIKCVFDKNHYLPGETAYLGVELDNSNCELDIILVQATFQNSLHLRSNKGKEHHFSRTYVSQTIQGIQARMKAIGNDSKQIQLLLYDKNKTEGINPSSNGQIIKSQYTLKVKAQLDRCTCCNQDPHVEVPIEIISPVPKIDNEQIHQPSNWNPQIFQPQFVQFTDNTMYQKDQQQQPNYNYPPPEQNQFGQMIKPMS